MASLSSRSTQHTRGLGNAPARTTVLALEKVVTFVTVTTNKQHVAGCVAWAQSPSPEWARQQLWVQPHASSRAGSARSQAARAPGQSMRLLAR